MSTTTATDQVPATNQRTAFISARLASILAIAPLGVWTIIHVWNNLAAVQGAEAWQSAVTEYRNPSGVLLTSVVVMVPLLIHAIWGVRRLATARVNYPRYGFYANFKYVLQRLSAIGVLFFLGAHIWLAFLQPRLVHGRPEPFAEIAHEMHHHVPTLVVYLLGTLGVAYHLANGVYGVLMGWGVVSSRAALKKLEWLILTLFVILLAMSWGAIYALFRAGA